MTAVLFRFLSQERHFVPPPRVDSGAQASTSGYEFGNQDGIRAAEKRVPNYKRHLMERRFLKITRGALRSGVRVRFIFLAL